MYRMFGGKTRCITGDVQMANGTQSRLWGLAAINCGCGREGSNIKGTGRCSTLSFATRVKKKKKPQVAFRTWQLHFLYHLCYTHIWKNDDKPSPVSVGLKLCLLFSVISTHKPLFLALYCLPLLYAQNDSFLPNLFISSYHPRLKINT